MTSFFISVALTLHVNQFSGQTVDIVFFGTGTKNYSVGGLFVSLVFGLVSVALTLHVNQFSGQTVDIAFLVLVLGRGALLGLREGQLLVQSLLK